MPNKIRVAVFDIQNAGVSKFRIHNPYVHLQNTYRDEFHIDMIKGHQYSDEMNDDHDILILQSSIIMDDKAFKWLKKMKKMGKYIILDMDDYWHLPMSHQLHYKMKTDHKKLVNRLHIADFITTTTKTLAREILKYNKKVTVIPNAIDLNEKQFQNNVIESNKVRIGWVGGSSHLEDLKLIKGIPSKLRTHSIDTQVVMCGFDNQERNMKTGEIKTVEKPKTWIECEKLFTSNYDLRNKQYATHLKKYAKEEYHNIEGQFYRRIWSKDIKQYALAYNHIDIAIAPLVYNTFNSMKSQLKMIEAGFHKKPMIVSNCAPYLIDGIDNNNCLIVDNLKPKRAKKIWYKHIDRLLKEPSLRLDLGEKLYEDMTSKYNLDTVNKKRRALLKLVFKPTIV